MFERKYDWVQSEEPADDQVEALHQATGLSPLVVRILIARGYNTADKIKRFMTVDEKSFYDPFLMHDMEQACQRIQDAIVADEKIMIYGDYDVDGITSTAIMYETLTSYLGAQNVEYYIPDRFNDGYGPNRQVYERMVADGVQLLITVDNGVSGKDEVAYAQANGVDVIITDHHELPSELPEAVAIVHPAHPAGEYPFKSLSGAGVALMVAAALLEEFPQEMFDLATLGTVADVMPLVDENRALVKVGLQVLQNTSRPGLQALYKEAEVDVAHLNEETIQFALAPRLNSLGRMGSAAIAVQLLTSLDDELVVDLAQQVEEVNAKRKQTVDTENEQAQELLDPEQKVNILAQVGWHEGVSGILAGRILEQTNKPTIIFSIDQTTGLAKGSGRSNDNFDLFAALDPHRDLFENFGGHKKACGLTIKKEKLPELTTLLQTEAQKQGIKTVSKPTQHLATTLRVDDITVDLIKELSQLGPFGEENPAPVFAFKDYELVQAKTIGKNNNYLRLLLKQKGGTIAALSFAPLSQAQLAAIVADPSPVTFIGTLALNYWRNTVTPQIMIADLEYAGIRILDQRTTRLTAQRLTTTGTYICFNERLAQTIKPLLPQAATLRLATEVMKQASATTPLLVDELVLVDMPQSLTELQELLQVIAPQTIRAILYVKDEAYMNGMPTRADFANVYRFVSRQQNFDIRTNLPKMVKYFHLQREQIIFILQVFFEVGFVKINDGVLSGQQVTGHFNLKQTNTYQRRLEMMAIQEKLFYSDFAQLREWFQKQLKS